MLTDDQIKQIFLECDNRNPEGVYADDVDILEFGRKLEQKVREESALDEMVECVKIVKSLNTHVADALMEKRQWSLRLALKKSKDGQQTMTTATGR